MISLPILANETLAYLPTFTLTGISLTGISIISKGFLPLKVSGQKM